MKRVIEALVAMTFALGSIPGISGAAEPIKVGFLVPRTGPAALFGEFSNKGAVLAVEELNARGGVLGRPIQLFPEDTEGKPSTAVSMMNKVVYSTKVNFVLGPDISSETLAAMSIPQKERIVEITSSLAPKITQLGNPWIFRMRPSDLVASQALADYAANDLKIKDVAISLMRGDWGEGFGDSFAKAWGRKGLKVLTVERHLLGDRDFTGQVQNILRSKPQAVLTIALHAEAALFVKQLKQAGYTGVMLGANTLAQKYFIDLAGEMAEGIIAPVNYTNQNPSPHVAEFIKKFQQRWGVEPTDHAASYYDAVNILANAIQKAGSLESEKVKQAMHATCGYKGVTITYCYNDAGDPGNMYLVVKIHSGKPELLRAVDLRELY